MKKAYLFSIGIMMLSLALFACGGGDDDGGGANGGGQASKDWLSVPPSVELLPGGETKDIDLSANCSWTVTKDASTGSWLAVKPLAGSSSAKVELSAGKNETNNMRTTVLTVKGGSLPEKKVTVSQDYDRPDPNVGIPQPGDNTPMDF